MNKKIISMMLIILLACIGTTACASNLKKNIPNYNSDKKFMFGVYGGVPSTLDFYDENNNIVRNDVSIPEEKCLQYFQEMKDAGITMASGGYKFSSSSALRDLKMCEKVGMTYMLYDVALANLLMSDKEDDEIIRTVKTYYKEFLDSPAFAGISIADEPTISQIKNYDRANKLFKKIAPNKIFYINLFPFNAGEGRVGDYSEYIKTFTKHIDVDYFCYDHYVLYGSDKGNYIYDDFIYNFVLAKKAAPERKAYTVLQSIKHLSYRALTSAADATFQLYTALACGYEGFSWFCFWPPVPFDGACNFDNGAYSRQTNEKTDTYNYLKDANNEIKLLENVYFNFKWQGIKTVIGTKNTNGGENYDFALSSVANVETERISSVKTEQDTLIGVFKDKENRDGYMFVNYTEPSANKENTVTITFNDCEKALIYKDGKQTIVKAKKGTISFTQKSGEGYFVIPLK